MFYGWRQVAIAMLIQAVSVGLIFSCYSIVAIAFSNTFEPSRMVLMFGLTATSLVGALLSPWLGSSVDRYSVRSLMMFGAAALTAGYFALSYVTSMWQVVLAYAVFVAPASVLSSSLPASVLLSRWFVRRRGFAMGIAAMGYSIGGFVFPPLVQYLIGHFEWRVGLRVLSVFIFLLTVPPIYLLVVDWPEDQNQYPDGDVELPAATPTAEVAPLGNIGVLRSPNFWVAALAVGIVMAAGAAVLGNLAPFALDIGTGPAQATLAISFYALANLAGMLVFTSIADRVDLRYALIAGEVILISSTLCFSSARTFPLLASGSALIGLSVGMITPLFGFLVARLYGAAMVGRVMGRMNTVIMLLLVLSPPLFGWVRDATGSYRYAFLVYSGLAALAAVFAPSIRLQPPASRGTLALSAHGVLILAVSCWTTTASAEPIEADKKAIEQVERSLAAATAIDEIMKFYAPGQETVVYDPIEAAPVRGARAIRASFSRQLSGLASLSADILELTVGTDGKLGYAYNVQRLNIQKKDGTREQHLIRQTDVLRKIHGRWLIVHEHFTYTK